MIFFKNTAYYTTLYYLFFCRSNDVTVGYQSVAALPPMFVWTKTKNSRRKWGGFSDCILGDKIPATFNMIHDREVTSPN